MRLILWIIPLLVVLTVPLSLQGQKKSPGFTVVIDAGHGGHDPGALGQHAREKDINLAIALKLGNMIHKAMKDVRVVYTRQKDVFVELYRRAEIANQNKADLFICIHCNANRNHTLSGAETYVMGLHKSQANLDIAKTENASILLESNYQATYNGFDPNADESYIIFSLYQNVNLVQSTELASVIQGNLEKSDANSTRGVRQAGFMVLYKTTMPSVLVETGFLSNPEEEKFLISDKGKEKIAEGIFRAFKKFREELAVTAVPAPGEEKRDQAPAKKAEEKVQPAGTVKDTGKTVKENAAPVPVRTSPGLSFRVQVAASPKTLSPGDPRLVKFTGVEMYQHGGLFKYTIGNETTLDAAGKLLETVKSKGVTDAFIVIFRNGSRIPDSEARRILGK